MTETKTELELFGENKEEMIRELLDSPIKKFTPTKEKQPDGKEGKVEVVKLSEIIDRKDIWFAQDKPRPIINEEGIRKLVRATGAKFVKNIFIEKPSEYGSDFKRGQTVIESTVFFPGADFDQREHTELGVANSLNCPNNISQSVMPIMAMKRAKERAFLRSEYINLYAYAESEAADTLTKLMENAVKEKERLQAELVEKEKAVKKAEDRFENITKKSTDFFDLVKKNTKVGGRSIWEMPDLGKIQRYVEKNKEKLSPLELRLFDIRMAELTKEQKKKEKEEKTKASNESKDETKEQKDTKQENEK